MRIELSLLLAAVIAGVDVFSIPALINDDLNDCNFTHLNDSTGTTNSPPCHKFTSTDHATVPSHTHCQKYCQCYNGNWSVYECDFNRNYDPSSNECVTDSNVCSYLTTTAPKSTETPETTTKLKGSSSKTSSSKGSSNTPSKSECQTDEKKPVKNCLDYQECDNGKLKKTSCFYLRFFNSTSKKCEMNIHFVKWDKWEYKCNATRDKSAW